MRYLLFTLLIACSVTAFAQDGHRALRRGDKAYKDRNYEEARRQYESALEKNNTAKGNYNAGNAAYEQGNFDERRPLPAGRIRGSRGIVQTKPARQPRRLRNQV